MSETKIENDRQPVTQVIGDSESAMKLKVLGAELQVIKGPDKGLKETIPPHGLVVGKSSACDIVLTDPAVSSVHFRIIPGNFGYRLEDFKSSNGTRVHDIRVSEAEVRDNKRIVIGQTTLHLKIKNEYNEYPLSNDCSLGAMVGRSAIMRQVFEMLTRAAASKATLLLEGESGTGKELAAEAVHQLSGASQGPFVVVDCSNMQTHLVGSQLFGHVKGAYTGATTDHVGAFEVAEGGTVFLDEIGELDPKLQPSLLRVLENKQIQPIGSNAYRTVNVRVIAATNKNLKSEMTKGRFREDLFYRLSVLRVHVPPLRDRREDIPLIASAMINQLRPDFSPGDILSGDVISMLHSHHWPGNVRELRNVIERLIVFPEINTQVFEVVGKSKHLREFSDLAEREFHDARNRVIEKFERDYATALLGECGGVVSHAAKKAGITRPTFHRLIKQHGIVKTKPK